MRWCTKIDKYEVWSYPLSLSTSVAFNDITIFTFFFFKVNRCLARYSPHATTTSQPTNRAPNEPALIKNAKFGHFWAKKPFFSGEIKSFVTHITENPPRHLVGIGYWSPWAEMGKKCQYLARNDQKCIFGTKFGRFWAKNPKLYGSK